MADDFLSTLLERLGSTRTPYMTPEDIARFNQALGRRSFTVPPAPAAAAPAPAVAEPTAAPAARPTVAAEPPPAPAAAAPAAPAAAAAAASPGFMSAAMRALGPLGALILADRFSSRNDPRLPPSFFKGPEELYVDAVKALRGQFAPEEPYPFPHENRPIGTETTIPPQTNRPAREGEGAVIPSGDPRNEGAYAFGPGTTPGKTDAIIPRAQIARPVQAPTPVASPTFMDMLAQQAAMRGRERESYGTETAPPLPSAPKREYEPGMRG